MLTEVFGHQGHVEPLQECARALAVFVYGLLAVRIVGRRVFGKWAALDIIVSIIVGSNLSRALTGSAPLAGTLLATTLLMAVHWVLARAVARWPQASRLLEGRAVEIARGGEAHTDVLRRYSVSEADLGEALRQSNVDDLDQTRTVTLEPSGKISVLKGG